MKERAGAGAEGGRGDPVAEERDPGLPNFQGRGDAGHPAELAVQEVSRRDLT